MNAMRNPHLGVGIALVAMLSTACSRQSDSSARSTEPGSVPRVDVAALPADLPDFFVRQRLQIAWKTDAHTLDCAVQHQGDVLTVVGLMPAGAKLFVLRQRGAEVSYEQFVPGKLPFEPQRILVDLQHAFLLGWSGKPTQASSRAQHAEMLHDAAGRQVQQIWRGGRVEERGVIEASTGQVVTRIRYEGGWDLLGFPARVVLESLRYGYVLRIESSEFQRLGSRK